MNIVGLVFALAMLAVGWIIVLTVPPITSWYLGLDTWVQMVLGFAVGIILGILGQRLSRRYG